MVGLAAEIGDGLRCLAEGKTGSRGAFVLRRRVLRKKRGVGRFFGGVAANFFVAFVCWFVTLCNDTVSDLKRNLDDWANEGLVF